MLRFPPTAPRAALPVRRRDEGAARIDYRSLALRPVTDEAVVLLPADLASAPVPRLRWSQDNPARYRVHVEGSDAPFVLALTEASSPGWRVRGLSAGAQARPLEVDGYRSGWVIEPPRPGPRHRVRTGTPRPGGAPRVAGRGRAVRAHPAGHAAGQAVHRSPEPARARARPAVLTRASARPPREPRVRRQLQTGAPAASTTKATLAGGTVTAPVLFAPRKGQLAVAGGGERLALTRCRGSEDWPVGRVEPPRGPTGGHRALSSGEE